ncbi:MAG: PfkB family carbohydrate kinase [Myxococcales bacterium]
MEFVTGESDPSKALRVLADKGVRLPVVTLGPKGVVALHQGRLLEASAPKVEVVDQTGAGDGFDAGLLASLTAHLRSGSRFQDLTGEQVSEAMAFGCKVGARVVTRLGAVAGLPRRSELR